MHAQASLDGWQGQLTPCGSGVDTTSLSQLSVAGSEGIVVGGRIGQVALLAMDLAVEPTREVANCLDKGVLGVVRYRPKMVDLDCICKRTPAVLGGRFARDARLTRTKEHALAVGERAYLMDYRGAFDGFPAVAAAVSKTCLVRFDRNRYSVASRAVGRTVDVCAYADRIVIRQDGATVG